VFGIDESVRRYSDFLVFCAATINHFESRLRSTQINIPPMGGRSFPYGCFSRAGRQAKEERKLTLAGRTSFPSTAVMRQSVGTPA